MSNKHAVKEAPASYQSTPAPLGSRELQNFIAGNPLTENLNLWISATKAKSTSGRGNNKKIELVGIKKLRELILELAVRGKLVPQNPEDEPASELLKKIDAEKTKLIAEGKIKKQKKLPEVSEDEKPFELPQGWEWAKLGRLTTKLTDGSHNPPRDAGSGYPMLSSQNVFSQKIDFSSPSRFVDEVSFEKENARTQIETNDVLLTIVASLGRSAVVPQNPPKFVLQRSVAVIQTKLQSHYLANQLVSPVCLKYYDIHAKGTAQKGIYLGKLGDMPISVPPLAEQHRIVAKVDELMALCDQLEQHSEHQLDAHKQLVETLLATLVESENADELATNWQRLAEHFDTLFSGALTSTAGIGNGGGEWAIDRLKDTILQLAVMGKLVPQNPDDEPASELLKKIETEKAKLVKEGKIKKQKPLPEITDEEKPFELPDGWEWVNLGNVVAIRGGKRVSNGYKLSKEETPYVYIRVSDFKNGTIDETDLHYIDKAMKDKIAQYIITSDDLYMTIVGATIGKCGQVPERFNGMNLTENAARITPILGASKHFLLKCLESNLGQEQFVDKTHQVGVQKMALSRLASALIPFPPLAEQHRIVAKVDELFTLCDQLKTRLQAASETQLTLTEALVEQALQ